MAAFFLRMIRGLGWFLVVSSVVCLTASLLFYVRTRRFVVSAKRAEGIVIKLVERQDPDSGTVYHPVVRFRDSDGREHEIYSSVGAYPPSFRVGDKVTMIYTDGRPEEAVVDGFWYVWLTPVLLGIVGLTHAVIALAFLAIDTWLSYRRNPNLAVAHAT